MILSFFPVSGREHKPHDVVFSFVLRLFKADTVVNDRMTANNEGRIRNLEIYGNQCQVKVKF